MAIVISECGQNHMGSMNLALKMIDLSQECGADLAKFQLFDPDKLYTPDFKLYKEVKEAELTFDMAKELFDYGKKVGIEVFFSVFDVERVKWCEEIGVKRYKIACSVYNKVIWDIPSQTLIMPDVLKKVLAIGKEVIISNMDGLHLGVKAKSLYCIPKYPTLLSDIVFSDGMFEDEEEYHKEYDGFSDHTIGLSASKIALARGATIIEKHFCLDHWTGVDASLSANPYELKELVRWAKVCEQVL